MARISDCQFNIDSHKFQLMTVIYELGSLHGCVEIEVFYVKCAVFCTFGRYDTVEVNFDCGNVLKYLWMYL